MPTSTSDGSPATPSSQASHRSNPAEVFLKDIALQGSEPRSSTAPITWSDLATSTPA